jgi:DNA-binding response OmpR family regulator
MPPRTILLIDPDPDSLEIYSLMLEHYGFRVVCASNVEEGVLRAAEQAPELVVVEPFSRSSGRPVLDALAGDPHTSGLAILPLTSAPTRMDGGGFLVKPCRPTELLAEVRKRLPPPLESLS